MSSITEKVGDLLIELIRKKPYVIFPLTAVIGSLAALVILNLLIKSEFPYVAGFRSDRPNLIVNSSISAVGLIGAIIFVILLNREEPEASDDANKSTATNKKAVLLTDLETVDSILHVNTAHESVLSDPSITYSKIRVNAIVDKNGGYFGIYSRKGVVTAKVGIDFITIHVSASGPARVFEELCMTAFDGVENRHLECTIIEETYRCKVVRVNFAEPKLIGTPVDVRWYFTWPQAMNVKGDGDTVNVAVFEHLPSDVDFSLRLPGSAASIRAEERVLSQSRFVELESLNSPILKSSYRLRAKPSRDTVGYRIYYKITQDYKALASIKDIVSIRTARREDLSQIAQIEQAAEATEPATVETLKERLDMFNEGFLVATFGEDVVGYVESCRWNRNSVDSFEEINNFPVEHTSEGKNLYIIFLCVVKPFRAFGIGSKLMNEIVNRQKDEVDTVQLVSKPELTDFYAEIGFKKEKDVEGFVTSRTSIFMVLKSPQN